MSADYLTPAEKRAEKRRLEIKLLISYHEAAIEDLQNESKMLDAPPLLEVAQSAKEDQS